MKLPKYLKALPIPKTFGGFSDLSREEWLELLPLMIMVGIVAYLVIAPLFGEPYIRNRSLYICVQ